jgi:AcrR family transcriptional regulator
MTEPRWQRRKDARPDEILDAALDLFVARGFAATRMDEVARKAGVTKGTVYLYFPSKEDLFKAVVRAWVLPEIEVGEHLLAERHDDWAGLLEILLVRWAERMLSDRSGGLSKLMIAEASNFPELAAFYFDAVVLRGRRLFATVIERGIAAGEFRPVDVNLMTRAVIAPLMMVKVWRHSFAACESAPIDPVTFARFQFELMMNGLKAA